MTKKEAAATDGDKVKKPQTSFFLFMNDRRAKFKEDNPELSLGQITKGLTDVWKALTDDEKKKYDDLAAKDRERYNKELEAQGIKPKPVKSKDSDGAPKKAQTAYFLYLGEMREKVKKENPDMSMCQQSKLIAEKWKALTEDDKKKYQDLSAKDKERYEKQKKEFEETGKFTPQSDMEAKNTEESDNDQKDKASEEPKASAEPAEEQA